MNLDKYTISPTIVAIYSHHEGRQRRYFSNRLGASQIGDECERKLWYGFRWAWHRKHGGQLLRLFETGHREEDRMIAELRAVGVHVWDRDPDTGKQFEWTACGGHFICKPDGVVLGIKEAEKTPHALEIKTMNDKNFKAWQKKGVKISHPKYYAQAQMEMHTGELDRAYFMAENKNTSELAAERIYKDEAEAIKLVAKAQRVIDADKPPEKIAPSDDDFRCKFCDFRFTCQRKHMPEVNCRTCAHSTPVDGGGWKCEYHDTSLTYDDQMAGCNNHVYNPYMLPWLTVESAGRDFVEYVTGDGEVVRNGDGGMSSAEMREKLSP